MLLLSVDHNFKTLQVYVFNGLHQKNFHELWNKTIKI
jgi:hypothetical protein